MNPVNTKPWQLPADATWLITGCSSGIGRALAELVAGKPGQRLIATARNISGLSYLADNDPEVLKLTLDVASPASVDGAFKAAAAHFGGRVDVLVNNAGYELAGDTEAATEEEMHDQLETNFFGTVRVALKAIEVMRQPAPERRGGLIFNISSLAGVAAFPGFAFYHASKFAVEGWTESVAREMNPDWNIHMCLVEPGGIKTNFEHGSKKYTAVHEAYDGADMPARRLAAWVKKGIETGAAGGVEPAAVAEVLYRVASRGDENVPLWLPLTSTAAGLIRMKLQARLANLEAVGGLTPIEQKTA